MDWTQWTAQLLAAGVGGFLGGTVGAYWKGYSEEKGRHLATFEDIQALLAIKFSEQAESERARFEILKQSLSTVQAEAERKKAGELRAQRKRDTYATLLDTSHSLHQTLLELSDASQMIAVGGPLIQEAAAEGYRRGTAKDTELCTILSREAGSAEIFLSGQSAALAQEFKSWKVSRSAVPFPEQAAFIESWRNRLIAAAKADLELLV